MKFLIIIPVHNEEEYLPLCLNSLKGQSYQDFECVVVDDGSTDNTRKIIEQFAEDNTRFELKALDKSEHQPGAKVVNAFNEGLKVYTQCSFKQLSTWLFPYASTHQFMKPYILRKDIT